jgi:hypothetical protein
MANEKLRDAKEYHATTVFNAWPETKQRDILLAFRGDPQDEEYDLVIRMGVGIVPALIAALYKASIEFNKADPDTPVPAQLLKISDAHSAEPIGDNCAFALTLESFVLPTVISREVAVKMIVELEKAVAGLDRGARKRKKPT